MVALSGDKHEKLPVSDTPATDAPAADVDGLLAMGTSALMGNADAVTTALGTLANSTDPRVAALVAQLQQVKTAQDSQTPPAAKADVGGIVTPEVAATGGTLETADGTKMGVGTAADTLGGTTTTGVVANKDGAAISQTVADVKGEVLASTAKSAAWTDRTAGRTPSGVAGKSVI